MSDQNEDQYRGEEAQQQVVEPATAPAATIPEETWETAVSTWINDHLRNSPVAGATEAWNHLHAVLPHLRQYLESELSK